MICAEAQSPDLQHRAQVELFYIEVLLCTQKKSLFFSLDLATGQGRSNALPANHAATQPHLGTSCGTPTGLESSRLLPSASYTTPSPFNNLYCCCRSHRSLVALSPTPLHPLMPPDPAVPPLQGIPEPRRLPPGPPVPAISSSPTSSLLSPRANSPALPSSPSLISWPSSS